MIMVLCLLLLLLLLLLILVMRPAFYGGWKAYVLLQRYCFTWLFLSESHELPLEVTVLSASPLQPHQRYITPYSSRKAL